MNSKGFTLLEVLITLVIFSFGLLALANLVLKSTQYNASALHRSYASSQAYDLADRIRANVVDCSKSGVDPMTLAEINSCKSTCQSTYSGQNETDTRRTCVAGCDPYASSRCLSKSTFETERMAYESIASASAQSCATSASGNCSATQMATHDLWEWNQVNAAVLPGGTGTVTYTSPSYTITITWDDNRDGSADDSFPFSFRP